MKAAASSRILSLALSKEQSKLKRAFYKWRFLVYSLKSDIEIVMQERYVEEIESSGYQSDY